MKADRLRPEDLLETIENQIKTQLYPPPKAIHGVILSEAHVHRSTDGTFVELLRICGPGEAEGLPGFHPIQWNWSIMEPGAVKAWHLHLSQDDLWIIPPDSTLLVGLTDLRRASPTACETLRLILGGGRCHKLLIPRGVAHGVANLGSRPQALLYTVNQLFTPDPDLNDEWRLPSDHFGAKFWQIDRD